jgi:hypothetical protein
MNKTNQDKVVALLEKKGGTFQSLGVKTQKEPICCKFLSASPKFVSIWDVNNKKNRRVSRESITSYRCGEISVS